MCTSWTGRPGTQLEWECNILPCLCLFPLFLSCFTVWPCLLLFFWWFPGSSTSPCPSPGVGLLLSPLMLHSCYLSHVCVFLPHCSALPFFIHCLFMCLCVVLDLMCPGYFLFSDSCPIRFPVPSFTSRLSPFVFDCFYHRLKKPTCLLPPHLLLYHRLNRGTTSTNNCSGCRSPYDKQTVLPFIFSTFSVTGLFGQTTKCQIRKSFCDLLSLVFLHWTQ